MSCQGFPRPRIQEEIDPCHEVPIQTKAIQQKDADLEASGESQEAGHLKGIRETHSGVVGEPREEEADEVGVSPSSQTLALGRTGLKSRVHSYYGGSCALGRRPRRSGLGNRS